MSVFRLIVELVGGFGVLGGVAVWLLTTLRQLKDGIKCLLRTDMMKTYYKHSGEDRLREYEKKNFLLEFAAYKALGGNSFIDDIARDVRTWEVTP